MKAVDTAGDCAVEFKMDWISVEDELPEDYTWTFTVERRGEGMGWFVKKRLFKIYSGKNRNTIRPNPWGAQVSKVYFWMPIPMDIEWEGEKRKVQCRMDW